MTRRLACQRLLRDLAAVIVTLSAAELALRCFLPQIPFLQGGAYYEQHARRGWTLRPGAHLVIKTAEVAINSLGLRDDEVATPVRGECRVLALGDSFTFSPGPIERSFVRIAQSRLRATRPLVRVINAGVPGYGLPQELDLLEEIAPRTLPTLVMLGFYVGNDFADALPDAKDMLLVDDGMTMTRAAATAREHVRQRPFGKLLNTWQTAWHSSHVVRLIRRVLPVERSDGNEGGHLLWYAREQLRLYWTGDAHWWAQRCDAVREGLRRLDGTAKQVGAKLCTVVMPDRLQVHPDAVRVIYEKWPELAKVPLDFDRPQRDVIEILSDLAIPTLDLLPIMREAGVGRPLYGEDGTHWNADGERVAAEAIVTFLERSGLLDS